MIEMWLFNKFEESKEEVIKYIVDVYEFYKK